MSGIFGIVHLDGASADRRLMRDLAAYMGCAGPDRAGTWCDGPVGLGHTLLRTRDDEIERAQPASFDERLWIAADARIDARDDLLAALGPHESARLAGACDA